MSALVRDLRADLEERKQAPHYVAAYDQFRRHWQEHQKRLQDVDRIARGRFRLFRGDGSVYTELPKTPNIVDLVLRDRSTLAAEIDPSLYQPTRKGASRSAAQKRERIARNYMTRSKVAMMRTVYFRDLYKAGVNYRLIEPDFASGYPCIRRLDPRNTLPDRSFTPERGLKSVIVAYKRTAAEIVADHPEKRAEIEALVGKKGLARLHGEQMEEIEYHDGSEMVRVAAYGGDKGVVLQRAPNHVGRLLVVAGVQPNDDGVFQGVFDQMLSVLEAENTIVNLLVDGAFDFVHSPIVSWNIRNPNDAGRAVLQAKSPDAFHRRMPPDAPSATVFGIAANLRGNAREAAVFPEARSGTIPQSQGSAAFVNAVLGNYSSAVALDQAIEADAEKQAIDLCFRVDEVYLDHRKEMDDTGETYLPSKDIAGHYAMDVNYGAGAGTDRFNAQIQVNAAVQNGIIPLKRARQLSPFVIDEVENENDIIREQILSGALEHMHALAQAGDFRVGALLAQALDDETDIYTILPQLAEFFTPEVAQQQQQQGTPTSALEQAASLSRGGQGGLTIPGVGALPPLTQLLGGGA